ncbi:hypothetical protein Tco_0407447 [Tanacetum coccineum]
MKDKVRQEHVCEEEVPLNNNIGKLSDDLVEMPSEAVEQGIDDHVPDEIDGVKGDKHFDVSIGGKKGNLEFLICKQMSQLLKVNINAENAMNESFMGYLLLLNVLDLKLPFYVFVVVSICDMIKRIQL